MKKLLPFIVIGLLSSCSNNKDIYPNLEDRVSQCYDFKNFEVPVRTGYATIVTWGEDTLAVATQPMTILIPKSAANLTKSEAVTSVKIDYAVLEERQATYSQFFQAVMFEDTENGDYDYNDLIIHVRNRVESNKQIIDIQPIALGGGKTILLGCILPDNSEHIISADVREDLFEGRTGHINTSEDITPYRYKFVNHITGNPLNGKVAAIAWFIEVGDNRYYAVNSQLDYQKYMMFNPEGMPYGLVRTSTFTYPQEKVSIFKAYPDFKEWINSKKNNIGSNIPSLCYKYASLKLIPGPDGQNHTVWDYQDLE